MSDSILSHTYTIPVVLGVVSGSGLLAALLVDGAAEWLALGAIAAPLVVVAAALWKGLRV